MNLAYFWFTSCWLVWNKSRHWFGNSVAVCHRCEWLCGEGDWGLVDVLKAPVLVNKHTEIQWGTSGADRAASCRPSWGGDAVNVSGGSETACVGSYPCSHSCCQLTWRCQWWPLNSACCRCRLEGRKVVTLFNLSNEDLSWSKWVPNSPKEPYSYGEAGVFPVEKRKKVYNEEPNEHNKLHTWKQKLPRAKLYEH